MRGSASTFNPEVFNFHWTRVLFALLLQARSFVPDFNVCPNSVCVLSPFTFAPGLGLHPLYFDVSFRRLLSQPQPRPPVPPGCGVPPGDEQPDCEKSPDAEFADRGEPNARGSAGI